MCKVGLPRWLSGRESAYQGKRCRRPRFHPCVRKIPWRKKWQPIAVFLTGKSHGWRSLAGYSLRGRKELDRTIYARVEVLCKYTPFHIRDSSIFGFWYPWASWTIPQEYQETTIPLKLLHIINHQRNANQNHKEIAPEIC